MAWSWVGAVFSWKDYLFEKSKSDPTLLCFLIKQTINRPSYPGPDSTNNRQSFDCGISRAFSDLTNDRLSFDYGIPRA